MQKGIRFTVVFSLGHEWLLSGGFYAKFTLFHENHEFHMFSWKSMNSADFACGSGTSVCGAKRHINSCSFLGIPDDTFAGNSWISWFPRFSHKIMNFYKIHDFSGISWNSCFPAPSAPSGAMKRLRNYYCFLTLGAQRAQKRGFHQKSWNSRENPQNPPIYKTYVKFPWNLWFLLFPHLAAHLRKPFIFIVNSMPFGGPIRSKSRVLVKSVESGDFHALFGEIT